MTGEHPAAGRGGDNQLGAVILCGGYSRRMGQDKAWLNVGDRDRALLTHITNVIASCCAPVVVVARRDQSLPPLPPGAHRVNDPPPAPTQQNMVANADPANVGPLVALHRGLEQLQRQGCMNAYLAAVDQPLVSAEHIRHMSRILREHPKADAVIVVDEHSRLHPFASVVRVTPAVDHARSLIAAGERRAQALFVRLTGERISKSRLPDPDVVHPCNTADEWHMLRARIHP